MRVNRVRRATEKVLASDGTPRLRCYSCDSPILPGDTYQWVRLELMFNKKTIACVDHPFRRSEIEEHPASRRLAATQERLQEVANGLLAGRTDLDALIDALEGAIEASGETGMAYARAHEVTGFRIPHHEEAVLACTQWGDSLRSLLVQVVPASPSSLNMSESGFAASLVCHVQEVIDGLTWSGDPVDEEEIRVPVESDPSIQGRLMMLRSAYSKTPEPFWSGKEAAEYLGVPYGTLRYWAFHSRGPQSHKIGRYRMYRQSELDVWAESIRDPRRRDKREAAHS